MLGSTPDPMGKKEDSDVDSGEEDRTIDISWKVGLCIFLSLIQCLEGEGLLTWRKRSYHQIQRETINFEGDLHE